MTDHVRPHLVAVAGLPGSGTTTLCGLLAKRMGMAHVYAGAVFRAMANERGLSLADFGAYAESHPDIDTQLDRRMIDDARKGGVVLEGRMVVWQCRKAGVDALKVLLEAPEEVRAQRVAQREGREQIVDVLKENRQREASEAKRYREIYGLDPNDPRHYDLVLDSRANGPEALADIVEARWRGPV